MTLLLQSSIKSRCCVKLSFVSPSFILFGTPNSLLVQTIFYVPRSSSCIHQVSDYDSNLVTTPFSSIDLTSQSVSHLSVSFLCIILLILDKLKIEMTKDPLCHAGNDGEHFYGENLHNAANNGSTPVWRFSMEIISTHITSTSLVVPIRAYKRLNIFAILSIASFCWT